MTTNKHTEQSERAELIRHMVNRFLGWKLPQDFYPDSFIGFDREKHDTWGGYPKSWPTGTNLFTADQAKQMLEHLMDGYEPASKPVRDLTEAMNASGCERIKDFYSVGPVQRSAIESFASALLAADKAGLEVVAWCEPKYGHCQNMRGEICLAGNKDGICCPPDSCDIDDGVRTDPRHTNPSPQPSALPDNVVKDAERYRFVRTADKVSISTEAARDPVAYDAAIDAAMLKEGKV